MRIDERIGNEEKMKEIDAFGIYNIFKIEPVQDLALLSDALSAQIGMTLASLTDIHHLRSTDTDPIFPELMKKHFPQLYGNEDLRKLLYKSYERIFIHLRSEEDYLLSLEERKLLQNIREVQISKVRFELGLFDKGNLKREIDNFVKNIGQSYFDYEGGDIEDLWDICISEMKKEHAPIFNLLYPLIEDEKRQKRLKKKLNEFANYL